MEISTEFLESEHFMVPEKSSNRITFGCEIELSIEFNPDLVKFYKPIPFDEDEWLELSLEARRSKAAGFNIWAQKSNRKALTFEKTGDAPFSLPSGLYTEGTGMLEHKGDVASDLSFVYRQFLQFEEAMGPCQIQGHVVFKRQALPGFAAFSLFSADHSLHGILTQEYQCYLTNDRIPAGNFISPFVPPPDALSQIELQKSEDQLSTSEPFQLGLKFISAPVLRGPEIYGRHEDGSELIGIEIRQWDTPSVGEPPLPGRSRRVVESMAMVAQLLKQSRPFESFKIFSEVELANSSTLYQCFNFLGGDAPKSLLSTTEYLKLQTALEIAQQADLENGILARLDFALRHYPSAFFVCRNLLFCYPFRPWHNHPVLNRLNPEIKTSALRKYLLATTRYLEQLSSISTALNDAEVLTRARICVAQWASELEYFEHFENWTEDLWQTLSRHRSPSIAGATTEVGTRGSVPLQGL